jgi:hypothetical protein
VQSVIDKSAINSTGLADSVFQGRIAADLREPALELAPNKRRVEDEAGNRSITIVADAGRVAAKPDAAGGGSGRVSVDRVPTEESRRRKLVSGAATARCRKWELPRRVWLGFLTRAQRGWLAINSLFFFSPKIPIYHINRFCYSDYFFVFELLLSLIFSYI